MKMHFGNLSVGLLLTTAALCRAAPCMRADDPTAKPTPPRTAANVPVTAETVSGEPEGVTASAQSGQANQSVASGSDKTPVSNSTLSESGDPKPPTEVPDNSRADVSLRDTPSGNQEPSDSVEAAEPKAHGQPARFIPSPEDQAAGTDKSESRFWNAPTWSMRTLGATGAVLGLILLAASVLKRTTRSLSSEGKAVSGLVEVLARYPFGRHQTLVLVKIDRRILILCQNQQKTTLISEITDPEEVVSILRKCRDDQGESFDRRLEDLIKQSEGGSGDDLNSAWDGSGSDGHDVVDLTRRSPRRNGRQRLAATSAHAAAGGVLG